MHTLVRPTMRLVPAFLLAFLVAFALKPAAHAQGGDHPDAGSAALGAAGGQAPEVVKGVLEDDGYTHWTLELDTSCRFYDHNYTLDIPEEPSQLSDILLTADTWDVDYRDPQDCKGGPEVDPVAFNGFPLGLLTGANDRWVVNDWPLTPEQMVKGLNRFHVSTDSTKTGCWCVGIGRLDLRARVGFDIVGTSPADDEQQVDFHADKAVIEVTFSAPLDVATVNDKTFSVGYRDAGGAFHEVRGDFTFSDRKQFTFKPSADLKDGVRYYVTVEGGAKGVKSAFGATLDAMHAWSFWTAPDLSLNDNFDMGGKSYCAPSPAPCRGVEIAVIQVARNARLVPYKDAVARIYVRWRRHDDVYADDQVKEMNANVALRLGGATLFEGAVTVKRPDLYSPMERSLARNTINIFHTPTDNFSYVAAITPLGGSHPLVQPARSDPLVGGRRPVITLEHYYLKAGDWKNGVPSEARDQQDFVVGEGVRLVDDMFPVISAAPLEMGSLAVNYSVLPTKTATKGCGNVRNVTCTLPNGTKTETTEVECIEATARTLANGSVPLTISVPENVCPEAVGLRRRDTNILFLMAKPGASPYVVPHELGHRFEISPANTPTRLHRNDATGTEGFQVRAKADGNRSMEESLQKPLSLMRTEQGGPADIYWIHNDDYSHLMGTIPEQNLTATSAGSYLFVSGAVDTGAGSARLDAVFASAEAIGVPTSEGTCSVALLDDANEVLNSIPFTPDGESDPDLFSTSGASPAPSGTASGPVPFSVSVPWDEAARSLQIACNGTTLLTRMRSTAAPSVAFTKPAEGATLSGPVQVTWTGSDADTSALAYQLQFSEDGGASWRPLNALGPDAAYSLDTTLLPSGPNHKLRVLASDGFNTAYATRAVTITNPLMVLGVSPQAYAKDVSVHAPVRWQFNTPIDPQTLTVQNVQILANLDPISTTLHLSEDGRLLTLQPSAPLRNGRYYGIRLSSALKDITGASVRFGGYSSSFITEADTTPPYVESTYPPDGATDVSRRALVQVNFNEDMAPFFTNQATLWLEDAAGQRVNGTVLNPSETGLRRLFRPATDLAANTTYTATLAATVQDAAGNPLGETRTWHFTTGADKGRYDYIVGNYFDAATDTDGDGLYDELAIYLDAQSQYGYDLSARLVDRNGQLIEWAQGKTDEAYPGFQAIGVNRYVLRFDGDVIRAHNVDGPYYLDAINYYPRPSIFIPLVPKGEVQFMAYRTLPYRVSDFAGVLSFKPLPDRLVEWNSSIENEWNLRDYTIDLARPVTEVTYSIVGNTDPRVGVSIDANANIDIHPQSGVETSSDVTVKGCDTAGNCAQGAFTVWVQKPQAVVIAAPPTVRVAPNASRTIEVEVQDQWGRRYVGGEVTLNFFTSKKQLGVVTPATATTSTGRATITYQAGATAGSDIIAIQIPKVTVAGTAVTITDPLEVYLPVLKSR